MALQIAIVVFLSYWGLFVRPAKARTFSSLDEIRRYGSLLANVSPDDGITGQFVLFPNMTFNCSGRITKVKFLALRTPRNLDLNFGVGRLKMNSYKVKHYIVRNVREGNTILFEQHFTPPRLLKFETGDVFALKQSDLFLMYNTDNTIELLSCSGPMSGQMYNCETDFGYQPLVIIETDCSDNDCDNCLMGVDELRERARYIPKFAEITTDKLFPDLKISEDGFVEKWTFTAQQSKRRPPLRTEYPQLIILPSDFRSEEAISCSNDRVHCLNSSTAVPTEYPNVYESAVTPPVPVKVGDYIAVHHPPDDRPALRLTFVRIPPVVPVTITSSEQLPLHPLVHLHIVKEISSIPGETTTTTTVHLEPTIAVHPKEQDRDSSVAEDSNIGVIAGGAVGGVLALVVSIVIATLIVAVVVLRSKNRGKVTTAQVEGTTNPVYGTNSTAAAELTNTGENTLASQIYAEPNTRNDSGDGATRPDAQYSVATEQSTQLNNTTGHIDAITNAEYFLTTTVNVVTENHYECAVYVPTKEQREQLSPSEVNVYATLEEAQVGRKKEKLSFFDECEIYWDPAPSRDGLYAQLANRKYREIPSSCIRETGHLGSGEFGTVNRGVWLDGARSVDVAIKKLKDDCCEEEAVRFLQEAAIMGQFRHPNIVQLLGVVTIVKPVMIVTELAHNGNLREYLLSKFSTDPGELPPPETGGLLSQFCVQVARGMEYLSGKAFVHRDLAARNILVTDSKTCKISDFGLSRDLDDSYYVSRGGQIPIKWTAPEALHYKKYSTASDVWSFGCLVYEMWSLGHKPFEGYTNPDTLKLIDNGCRLAPPPGCPLEMYRLMITCWNADKSCRPQFREIVETLSQPESLLLHIPEEVTRGHPQASVLGAPLEAGRNLYTELQNTYM